MTNEKIILKVQEIQANVEMLSRKIDEQEPQEVKKVVVDVESIIIQSVNECKKLVAPLKAQNTKLKKDNAIIVDELTKEIDNLTKENNKTKISIDKLSNETTKESSRIDGLLKARDKKNNLLIEGLNKNTNDLSNFNKSHTASIDKLAGDTFKKTSAIEKLNKDKDKSNNLLIEDLQERIDRLSNKNKSLEDDLTFMSNTLQKSISDLSTELEKSKQFIKNLDEGYRKEITNTLEKVKINKSACSNKIDAVINSQDHIEKDLMQKINLLSSGINQGISSAIQEEVNINFVNNLYRNK